MISFLPVLPSRRRHTCLNYWIIRYSQASHGLLLWLHSSKKKRWTCGCQKHHRHWLRPLWAVWKLNGSCWKSPVKILGLIHRRQKNIPLSWLKDASFVRIFYQTYSDCTFISVASDLDYVAAPDLYLSVVLVLPDRLMHSTKSGSLKWWEFPVVNLQKLSLLIKILRFHSSVAMQRL